jgi:hypothetical protein
VKFLWSTHLKRNLTIQYSNKKLEAYEKISTSYNEILIDIVRYSKSGSEFKEPYNVFKLKKLNDIQAAERSFYPYKFYIETLSIGIRLANFYNNILHLFKDDCLAEWKEIEKINFDFGMIEAIMQKELLGADHLEKFCAEYNTDNNKNR